MTILKGFIALLVAAAIAVALVHVFSSSPSGYELRFNFADADGLLKGSRVEVGGVGVGSVTKLAVTGQDHALVTARLNPADAPVGTDASAIIRPADLLGEKYIDLTVGNRADPARPGFTVPTSRTQTATDFDQVVDVLGPTEQDRLAILIHETGVALFGRGVDVAQLLQALPPSLTDAQDLISQLTRSNDQMKGLLTHSSGVMASLASSQNALQRFVSTAAGALNATAQHQTDLEATVAAAPGLLTQLDTSLGDLDVAGDHLRPAAVGLERTAPALTDTLRSLPGFTAAALPTLAEVRAISPQLVTLGREASPVIARLRPTLAALATLATASKPVTNSLDEGIDDLLGTLQGWARALQETDGLSHEFRVSAEFPPALISELTSGFLTTVTSSASARHSADRTGQHRTPGTKHRGATGSPPGGGASSITKSLGSTVSGALGNLLGGVSNTVGGVGAAAGGTSTTAGSSQSQATGGSLKTLLGYLLGGK